MVDRSALRRRPRGPMRGPANGSRSASTARGCRQRCDDDRGRLTRAHGRDPRCAQRTEIWRDHPRQENKPTGTLGPPRPGQQSLGSGLAVDGCRRYSRAACCGQTTPPRRRACALPWGFACMTVDDARRAREDAATDARNASPNRLHDRWGVHLPPTKSRSASRVFTRRPPGRGGAAPGRLHTTLLLASAPAQLALISFGLGR
jgi:hypothetical protein